MDFCESRLVYRVPGQAPKPQRNHVWEKPSGGWRIVGREKRGELFCLIAWKVCSGFTGSVASRPLMLQHSQWGVYGVAKLFTVWGQELKGRRGQSMSYNLPPEPVLKVSLYPGLETNTLKQEGASGGISDLN